MTALGLALALAAQAPLGPWAGAPAAPTTGWGPWRLVDRPMLHVGVRPALYLDNEADGGRLELGAGVTVQVTR